MSYEKMMDYEVMAYEIWTLVLVLLFVLVVGAAIVRSVYAKPDK